MPVFEILKEAAGRFEVRDFQAFSELFFLLQQNRPTYWHIQCALLLKPFVKRVIQLLVLTSDTNGHKQVHIIKGRNSFGA